MTASNPIQINLQQIVSDRLGRRSRYIPDFLVRKLADLVCQDRLNDLLRTNFPKRGADFCEGVLNFLNLKVEMTGEIPDAANRRVLIVSNHPLGGVDGMSLIAILRSHYGCTVRFVVNDLLMAVEPLRDVFLPINKHGRQSRASLEAIDEAFAGNEPIIIFPAGLVSRRSADGTIADLEWQKMFVNKAIKFQRDIVPVYYSGTNSDTFYKFANLRKRLGLKFNFEMMLLPREMFKCEGRTFHAVAGQTIPWQQLSGGNDAQQQAQEIRKTVYGLAAKIKCDE
jgi:putative hemolysin